MFGYPGGPCYRCLYPEPPPPGLVPSCAEGGVLGVLPGIIGSIQAMETIKLILGNGEPLVGRLLLFDALGMHFREFKLRKNPDCPVCGEHPTITQAHRLRGILRSSGRGGPCNDHGIPEITPRELKARLDRGDDLFVLDVREPHEVQICKLYNGHLIPLGEFRGAPRARQLPRNCGLLPQWQAFGRCRRVSATGRLSQDMELEGRHSGLVG